MMTIRSGTSHSASATLDGTDPFSVHAHLQVSGSRPRVSVFSLAFLRSLIHDRAVSVSVDSFLFHKIHAYSDGCHMQSIVFLSLRTFQGFNMCQQRTCTLKSTSILVPSRAGQNPMTNISAILYRPIYRSILLTHQSLSTIFFRGFVKYELNS
jgi:hypothetical protein